MFSCVRISMIFRGLNMLKEANRAGTTGVSSHPTPAMENSSSVPPYATFRGMRYRTKGRTPDGRLILLRSNGGTFDAPKSCG